MQVTWRPFQLDPHAPREGVTKREAYALKFGPQRAAAMLSPSNPMVQRFRELGIEVSYEGLTGQTFDAHRARTRVSRSPAPPPAHPRRRARAPLMAARAGAPTWAQG